MLNTVILIGRLTKDPEGNRTKTGTPVAHFDLAVDNPTKDASGNFTTSFVPVQMWDKLCKNLFPFLHKGSKIALKGRLNQRTYTDKESKNRSVLEVVADTIILLDPKQQEEAPKKDTKKKDEPATDIPEPKDDLPF